MMHGPHSLDLRDRPVNHTPHPLAWLLLAAVLAYFNALAAGFQFDDFNVIVDNPAVHSLAAWWQDMPGMRPLLKLSYTLNWTSGLGAPGYHGVNLLLHLVNVVLVWRLSAHLPLPADWRDGAPAARVRLLATLLFALHPIQTEAVTYVTGRSMTLMASFALAGLLCWLDGERRPHPIRWRLVALALFAAAILTKEVAVVVPLALLLLPQTRATGRGGKLGLVGFTAAALLALFLAFGYQHLLAEPPPRPLGSNLVAEAHAVFYLIGQLFRPHALNIDPDLTERTAGPIVDLVPALGILALLVIAWVFRQRWPWLSFAIGWFFLLLLPTHSLIPRLDLASERHLYLSALSLYWLAGIGLAATVPARATSLGRAGVLSLALLGAFFVQQRNRDYRDEISLWQATVRLSPHKARVWNNLGYAHYLADQPQAARAAYLEALRLDPGFAKARANLDLLDAAVVDG